MCKKDEIKEIKHETKGFLEKHRTTSQGSDGTIAVSDWHDGKADAVRDSRERVGALQKEGKKK